MSHPRADDRVAGPSAEHGRLLFEQVVRDLSADLSADLVAELS